MSRQPMPIDLSLYLVLDPDLCGGSAGMVATAQQAAASNEGSVNSVETLTPTPLPEGEGNAESIS